MVMIPHSDQAFCCLFTVTCLSLSHSFLCCFYRQCVFSAPCTGVRRRAEWSVWSDNSGPSAGVADQRRLPPPDLRADLFPSSTLILISTLDVSCLCFLRFCVSIYFLQDDPKPFASLYCHVTLHIFVLGVLRGRLSAFVLPSLSMPLTSPPKTFQWMTLAQSPSRAHCSLLVPAPSPLVQGLTYLLAHRSLATVRCSWSRCRRHCHTHDRS